MAHSYFRIFQTQLALSALLGCANVTNNDKRPRLVVLDAMRADSAWTWDKGRDFRCYRLPLSTRHRSIL